MNLTVKSGRSHGLSSPSPLPLAGRGVFFHASAVMTQNGAILFLGHSGSGKTTLSGLLAEHFEVLADDTIFLEKQKSGLWVLNKEVDYNKLCFAHAYQPDSLVSHDGLPLYPLHSIIRIFGAQKTEIIPLQPIKICEYLMDAIFEIDLQRHCKDTEIICQWFSHAANIAKQYMGWQLRFSQNSTEILHAFKKINDNGFNKHCAH